MSTATEPGLSRCLRAEALAFRRDMREFGAELARPGQISPEELAQRFYRNAVSVARQQQMSTHRSYLEEVRALVREDLDMQPMADPLDQAFLTSLHTLLDEALQAAGVEFTNGGEPGVKLTRKT